MPSASRPYSTIQDPRTHKYLVNAKELSWKMEETLGYSYSAQYLRRLTNQGHIPATKYKGVWFYDADHVIETLAPGSHERNTDNQNTVDWL